ncbi:hypothetical protein [Candidatus Methylomirabilis sp.]|uniref:hypothetical protein n=1 Tax=Candidatus Methylomirabilis sp. TaxID=2032687 RepID=UPI003C716E79
MPSNLGHVKTLQEVETPIEAPDTLRNPKHPLHRAVQIAAKVQRQTPEVRLRFLGLTRKVEQFSEKPVSVQAAALSILKAETRPLIIMSRTAPREPVTRWANTLKVGGKTRARSMR